MFISMVVSICCCDPAKISWTPLYGKQVDLSASSGPLHSLCERKHGMNINRQEMSEVAWKQNTMRPGFDAGKHCKAIMLSKVTVAVL